MRTDLVLNDQPLSYCIAAPLRVGDDSLGALLLLNADRPFEPGEVRLVQDAVSQIDYAMQHNRTLRELRRRQRELEAIYRIDRLRDGGPPISGAAGYGAGRGGQGAGERDRLSDAV